MYMYMYMCMLSVCEQHSVNTVNFVYGRACGRVCVWLPATGKLILIVL